MEINWVVVCLVVFLVIMLMWLVHIIRYYLTMRRENRRLTKMVNDAKKIETKFSAIIDEMAGKQKK